MCFFVVTEAAKISNFAPNWQEEDWSDDKDKEQEQEEVKTQDKKRRNPPKKGGSKTFSKSQKIAITLPIKAPFAKVFYLFSLIFPCIDFYLKFLIDQQSYQFSLSQSLRENPTFCHSLQSKCLLFFINFHIFWFISHY